MATFKVGDIVVVARKASSGTPPYWIPQMDDTVGQVGQISDLWSSGTPRSWTVTFEHDKMGWAYPEECLTLAPEHLTTFYRACYYQSLKGSSTASLEDF
jgi:hypothetical protein